MKSALEKTVRVTMKKVRGEGFSIRFAKRPFSHKRTQDAAQDNIVPEIPEETVMQEKAVIRADVRPVPSPSLSETKLWFAARHGDCATIRRLVMDGVDLDARDMDGRTALNIATQYNQQNALKTLLAAREMKRMAAMGDLPGTSFFKKFSARTGI